MFGADLTPKEAIPLPGSRPASFASASDRSQSALPAEKANLWKAATRKPMVTVQPCFKTVVFVIVRSALCDEAMTSQTVLM
jgi:hypothetical protein